MSISTLLETVLQDQDLVKEGFQPSKIYVLVCLTVPLLAGLIVGLVIPKIRRLLKLGD